MAKIISGAEATTVLGMSAAGRAAYLRAMKTWFGQGAQLAEAFVAAAGTLGIPVTADHDTAIKAALTPWFQAQPDTADYP
jgi:hypothetical protein